MRSSTTPRKPLVTALGSIALDAAPPLSIFYVLHALGVSDVIAYTVGGIVPLVRLVVDRFRGRPFNIVSGLVLALLVVSVVLALLTHDARAVIARGGVIYLVLALIAAATVPTTKPVMLVLSRRVAVSAHPESAEKFDATFAQPAGLRAMRVLTAAWAVGFLISAIVCVVCAYELPVTAAATVTALVEPLTAVVLAAGTTPFLRRALLPSTAVQRIPEEESVEQS